ncbi:hypothetical protein OHB39_38860 [Streptomyces sp. NBC_00047]|uniref:hypothetical protein n=1 Tax=Streptomyces sp. NBC_00047 TaxID=2975627 RepID=UPI002255B6AF|nr:hypothetical protein [Streptomyces sp. NBC_00047]MCX5613008.1 hypothetical protein [Streptomyces sp. NBC_00047]MCX5613424.1 hypothetical protein [Streptomyces sp. NBC_00047]
MTTPAQARLAVVLDTGDDAAFTHGALAAHAPHAGRITLHPTPGTTSDATLAGDLLLALGKLPRLPGRFPHGRPPLWEAAAAWMAALEVTCLTVLRAHLLDERRLARLLGLQRQTGIRLTLVVHRPRLTAALTRALAGTGYTTVETRPGAGSPSMPWTGSSPTTVPGPAPAAASRGRSSTSSALHLLRRVRPRAPTSPTVCMRRHRTQLVPPPSRRPSSYAPRSSSSSLPAWTASTTPAAP